MRCFERHRLVVGGLHRPARQSDFLESEDCQAHPLTFEGVAGAEDLAVRRVQLGHQRFQTSIQLVHQKELFPSRIPERTEPNVPLALALHIEDPFAGFDLRRLQAIEEFLFAAVEIIAEGGFGDLGQKGRFVEAAEPERERIPLARMMLKKQVFLATELEEFVGPDRWDVDDVAVSDRRGLVVRLKGRVRCEFHHHAAFE